MVLCFCSKSHGGPGNNVVPYKEHFFYCILYGDDIYGEYDYVMDQIRIIEGWWQKINLFVKF